MSIVLLGSHGLQPVASGLRALYRFDEGSGQTLTDQSAGQRHGTLGSTGGADGNDPSWTTAGLQFTTDDFVDGGAATELRPDGWTLCAAIRATPGSPVPAVGWGTTSFPAVYAAAPFNGNRPLIWLASSCFRYFESTDPVNVQDGGWHFFVFRCPANTAAGIQSSSLIVDGQSQAVNSTTSSTDGGVKTGFRIGAAASLYFAEAEIGFLSLHDRALSDGESETMRRFAKASLAGRVALP